MLISGQVKQQPRSAGQAPRGRRGRVAGLVLAVALYFALALLAAQTLGLLHGILHSPAPVAGATANSESAHQPHSVAARDCVTPHSSDASLLSQLFSGHLSDTDCRVYDQLSHFDAAPGVAAVALPLVLTPLVLSILPGLATARWHALFQARGPPSLR